MSDVCPTSSLGSCSPSWKGLGSALMRPTLERCDREGLPAYLEASSERNAALYERLGFELIRELRVAGSPPLRLMARPPVTG